MQKRGRQRLIYTKKVPHWILARVRRWVKAFNLNDWEISVKVENPAELTKHFEEGKKSKLDALRLVAFTNTDAPYKLASLAFSEELKNTPSCWATVFHEVRHIVYQDKLGAMVVRDIIKRYVPEEDQCSVQEQFDDAIEALIESDVYLLEGLTSL